MREIVWRCLLRYTRETWLFPLSSHSDIFISTAAIVYLESQQAAVDLGGLHQSATVIAADVCATLVAGQIDQ